MTLKKKSPRRKGWGKEGEQMEAKKFKSIRIDLEKGIYEINGEKAERITALRLEWAPEEGWALDISRNGIYIAP